VGKLDVGDESRREGSHGDTGQQIADQRRQTQTNGNKASHEGEGQADGDSSNKWTLM